MTRTEHIAVGEVGTDYDLFHGGAVRLSSVDPSTGSVTLTQLRSVDRETVKLSITTWLFLKASGAVRDGYNPNEATS